MGKAIEAKNLNIYYGSFLAVEGVSMTIRPQTVTALIGPSGCGKSTFLRSINRMHEVIPGARVEGSLELDGNDLYGPGVDPVGVRRQIGMVFQRPNPFPTMSIYDNVIAGQRLNNKRMRKDATDELVEQSLRGANLWNEVKDRLDKPGSGLSGGQQQRLCIARAIAVQPDVLLMDEPCSALDPISTLAIEDLINELKNEYTIVIVTHNMQQAARVSDYTGFFNIEGTGKPGHLVEMDVTKAIFSNPTGEGDRGLRVGPVRLERQGVRALPVTAYDDLAGHEHRVVGVALVVARQQREVDGGGHAVVPRRVHEHAEHVPVQAVHGVVVARELHREQHVAGARDLGGLARHGHGEAAHLGEVGAHRRGHGARPLGVLGDVQRQVAHPLQVTGGADRRHRGPQVARHRGVEEQRVGGDLLHPCAEGVDLRIAGDHLVRQAFPALQQRRGGVLHGDGRRRRHVGEEQRQVGELTRQRIGGHTVSGPGIRPVTT